MKMVKRDLEELNLMDDFLFFEAVSGEKGEWFCRLLIKAICQRDVKNIQIYPQNIIQGNDTMRHGIRMDLYVDESGSCLYDFEPDKYTDKKMLPKRNRYYRALLDGRLLESGKEYDKLPDMWTIFILTKDPFGKDRMCYTIKNKIIEEPDTQYEDGAVSLFLYTKGALGGNKQLTQLLNYLSESKEENAVSEELKELHCYVTSIKHRKEVGVRYMKSWELEKMWRKEAREEGLAEGRELGKRIGIEEGRKEGRKEGREEGREEGRKEGREEGIGQGRVETLKEMIFLVLAQKGKMSDEMIEKIQQQKDMDVLERWLHIVLETDLLGEIQEKLCDTVH